MPGIDDIMAPKRNVSLRFSSWRTVFECFATESIASELLHRAFRGRIAQVYQSNQDFIVSALRS